MVAIPNHAGSGGRRPAPSARPLAELLGQRGGPSVAISGLALDSRLVRSGDLFAALPGTRADGRDFIVDALRRGAVALLVPEGTELPEEARGVAVVEAREPRRLLAEIAARFHGPQPEIVVGVTGTNGKSSVVEFLRQAWALLGLEGASIGTLGIRRAERLAETGMTSPDPIRLHAALADLAHRGVGRVAIEASSHGLSQFRLDGVRFAAAAFTNLSRDHLDYHRTREAYFYAKARLVGELLPPGAPAVVVVEDEAGREMEMLAWGRGMAVLSIGRSGADWRITDWQATEEGQQALIECAGSAPIPVRLPLFGRFQLLNALVAAALIHRLEGLPPDAALAMLARFAPVPGRLERIGRTPAGGTVYLDYAHTPDGLHAVLEAVRPHAVGRLWVVFGCGGDRDRGKRPQMGEIADRLADRVIVTDDNPRSEDPAAIRAAILAAAPGALEIGDRREAIRRVLAAMRAGDALVIAGKGHETGQIVGDRILPHSDREVVEEWLKEQSS